MKLLIYSHKYKQRTSNIAYAINPNFKSRLSSEEMEKEIESWVSAKNRELKGGPGEYLKYEGTDELFGFVSFRYLKINRHPWVLGHSNNSWERWRRVYKPSLYYKQIVDEMNDWADTFKVYTPHKEVCDEIFDLLGI